MEREKGLLRDWGLERYWEHFEARQRTRKQRHEVMIEVQRRAIAVLEKQHSKVKEHIDRMSSATRDMGVATGIKKQPKEIVSEDARVATLREELLVLSRKLKRYDTKIRELGGLFLWRKGVEE